LTPAALLVLAFLEFNPFPVCTFVHPQGMATDDARRELPCPPYDMGNVSGFFHDGMGLKKCVRRFKL
jgi:hypothetical protein